jgi:ribonuclease Y
MRRGEGRRGEMTALDWVLVLAIVVLAGLVVVGLLLGARALRQLQSNKDHAKNSQERAVDDA